MNRLQIILLSTSIAFIGCSESTTHSIKKLDQNAPSVSQAVSPSEIVNTHFKLAGHLSSIESAKISLFPADQKSISFEQRQLYASGEVENGQFILEGEVPYPQFAYLQLVTPASVKTVRVLLEPGEINMEMEGRSVSFIGGKYGDIIDHSWVTQEYKDLLESANAKWLKSRTDKSLSEAEKQELTLASTRCRSESEAIQIAAIKSLSKDSDPLVRLFAVQSLGRFVDGGDWQIEALENLEIGNEYEEMIDKTLKLLKKDKLRLISEQDESLRDFTAKTLNGDSITFTDVLSENRFVLVDFWASWCGPCRAAFPHLKELYSEFHSQGFEIIGYSADDDAEVWKQAMGEEQLPWLNIRDEKGKEGDALIAYGVDRFPRTLLFDASNGKIVARDLHGAELDKKLKELFAE